MKVVFRRRGTEIFEDILTLAIVIYLTIFSQARTPITIAIGSLAITAAVIHYSIVGTISLLEKRDQRYSES